VTPHTDHHCDHPAAAVSYLGRPAEVWLAALRRRPRRGVVAACTTHTTRTTPITHRGSNRP